MTNDERSPDCRYSAAPNSDEVTTRDPRRSTKRRRSCIVAILLFLLLLVLLATGALLYIIIHSSGHLPLDVDYKPTERLTDHVIPMSYWWDVRVNLPTDEVKLDNRTAFTLEANISIVVRVQRETLVMFMHSLNLTIDADSVMITNRNESGDQVGVQSIDYFPQVQQVRFTLDKVLRRGFDYTISMKYKCEFSKALSGIYRIDYTEKGKTKHLAATQFQPTFARAALPSFDEPAMKADFHVSIDHPTSVTALSNQQVVRRRQLDALWTKTTFDVTPRMSTYLVAMVIGDFHSRNATTKFGTAVRVWATSELVDQCAVAANVGVKLLEYYEDYFDIPYPLKKQDMVAVPDFEAGAMENWGLVMYRSLFLLFDEAAMSIEMRLRIYEIVAHELAHQWFGNLVTMAWWDDLWLNEGFATYMQMKGTQVVDPTSGIASMFSVKTVQTGMNQDQWNTTRALQLQKAVVKPAKIQQLFDRIAYDKGAAVVRMMEMIVGDRTLQLGLRQYLKNNLYSTATMYDLFDTINYLFTSGEAVPSVPSPQEGKPLNITLIMYCWVKREGFPMVNVKVDKETNTAILSQSFFRIGAPSDPSKVPPECRQGWYIPVWYSTAVNDTNMFTWITPDVKETVIKLDYRVSSPNWLLVNREAMGYFRTKYDEHNMERLTEQLYTDYEAIEVNTRAQIVSDVLALAEAGHVDYTVPLKLIEYIANEREYAPWEAARGGLDMILSLFHDHKDGKYFKWYFKSLIDASFRRVATVPEKVNAFKSQLRAYSYKFACRLGNRECQGTAMTQFDEIKRRCAKGRKLSGQCNMADPSLRDVFYCEAAKRSDSAYNYLWDKLHVEKENVAIERYAIMYGLSCTRNHNNIITLMNEAIKHKTIQLSEIAQMFDNLRNNDAARPLIWSFVRRRIPFITQNIEGSTLGEVIRSSTHEFKTHAQLQDLMTLNATHGHLLLSASNAMQQVLTGVHHRIHFMEHYAPTVIEYCKGRPPPPTA